MQAGGKPEDLEISGQQTCATHTDTQERGPDTHESEESWELQQRSRRNRPISFIFLCLVSLGINGTSLTLLFFRSNLEGAGGKVRVALMSYESQEGNQC